MFNLWFSDVFRGYRKIPVVRNESRDFREDYYYANLKSQGNNEKWQIFHGFWHALSNLAMNLYPCVHEALI